MDLLKKVEIPAHKPLLEWDAPVSLWGSCFSTHLADYLSDRLFSIHRSPYGLMYNPLSIAEGMTRVLEDLEPQAQDLYEYNGQWHSSLHHGSYSDVYRSESLIRMKRDFGQYRENMGQVRLFIFTFGTAYVYRERMSGTVVNNCHKRPERDFERERILVGDIVKVWTKIIPSIRSLNPDAEILFTVSPVPHYRDGVHANKLSKSTLLLAIDELISRHPRVGYFPAYEILLDELRDYRYFREDMAHPTPMAVEYIMEKFMESYFEVDPHPDLTREWRRLRTMAGHRPLNSDPVAIQAHYELMINDLRALYAKASLPQVSSLIEEVESRMRSLDSGAE